MLRALLRGSEVYGTIGGDCCLVLRYNRTLLVLIAGCVLLLQWPTMLQQTLYLAFPTLKEQ